ncbi:MAG: PAS domain-containing protein, partial [Pseudomonadota bacterium]
MTSMVPNVPLPAVQLTSLLEHIPMGVFMIDADFRMAYVNKAASPVFDNIVGGVIGRDFDELIHEMRDPYYANAVTRVFRNTLETGDSYATAETSTAPGRPVGELYEWRVERVLMDDGRFGLAGFFRDITKEVYQHQLDTFRVALTDTLRPAASAADVQAAAAKLLGDQLVLGAVLYAEVVSRADSDYYIVQQYYRAEGSGDFNGEYRANDFGEVLFEEMRAGHTVVTNNVATEARLSPAEKQAHAALRVGSYIKVPLIKEGRHVALISIHQEQPRVWTPVEVALVEETAERTWAAAERARAEAKISEGQVDSARQRRLYEAVLSNTPDLAYVWNREHRFIYANEGLLKMWGKTLDEAIGKHCIELGYEPWHAQMHDREIDQVVATKRPMRGEVPFVGTFGRRVYDYILVPVFGPDGEVEAVAGTTRD